MNFDPEEVLDPHDFNDEEDDVDPYSKRCYSGYIKPINEQITTICKCMVEEEVLRRARKTGDKSPVKLWLDSMASHSITSDHNMFGVTGPNMKCRAYVSSWDKASPRKLITECGVTAFGMMLYDPDACGTIMSMYEVYATSSVTWNTNNEFKTTITPYGNENLNIEFVGNAQERVLEALVKHEDYTLICKMHSTRSWGAIDDVSIKAAKISSDDFRRAMEAVYAHRITGHICNSYLAKTAELGILSNMPFNSTDVHNIDRISQGNCPFCLAAKTKATSMKPAHR